MSGISLPNRPAPRKTRRNVQPQGDAAGLFRCMRCGHALDDGAPNQLACSECGLTVPIADGIIDFVGGLATTELDNIDYDQRYGISDEHSLNLYHLLLRATGPLWPKAFGHALEVGCGTGGLSLALLRNISARRVVLTDISPKMLRLCRTRLGSTADLSATAMTFATYSGTEPCFRPDVFDTCFGTAVVHHITDVARFLAHIHSVLKPGGCAFFMEPNLEFHRALTRTMGDTVAELLRDQSLCESDISLMLNWTGEVHCNIVNTGDIEVLAEREDKHFFVGETFVDWAKAAGFTPAAALPCDPDPTGWNTVQTYLDQNGVSAKGFAVLKQRWPSRHVRHFKHLTPADQSPSYLFWLRKPLHPPAIAAAPRPAAPAPVPQSQRPARTTLVLRLDRDGEDLVLLVTGWCVSGAPVRSVRISTDGVVRRIPIWRPRPDVQAAINRDNVYPPLHALCSGIEGTVRLHVSGAGDTVIQVAVDIVPVDGPPLPVRTVSLTVGGSVEISGP
jgi:SAM-dependent methyltransferase